MLISLVLLYGKIKAQILQRLLTLQTGAGLKQLSRNLLESW